MNDILKTYMERFRENRHTLRRYTAFVLALAMITTLFVNWQLHGVGISMTAQYQCGEEEHTHTADCYTKVLTCGYEEGELENADEVAAAAATSQPTVESEPAPLSLEPQIEFVPHEHTEDCYTEVQTLTCMEEEHVHDDDCFDPEDGSLIDADDETIVVFSHGDPIKAVLAHAFGIGDAEDLAGLQAIDVVGLEGRAVALEQGRQHLFDGDTVRTGLEGDAVEGVAGLDQVCPTGGGTARGGSLAWRARSGCTPGRLFDGTGG